MTGQQVAEYRPVNGSRRSTFKDSGRMHSQPNSVCLSPRTRGVDQTIQISEVNPDERSWHSSNRFRWRVAAPPTFWILHHSVSFSLSFLTANTQDILRFAAVIDHRDKNSVFLSGRGNWTMKIRYGLVEIVNPFFTRELLQHTFVLAR